MTDARMTELYNLLQHARGLFKGTGLSEETEAICAAALVQAFATDKLVASIDQATEDLCHYISHIG